MSWQDDFINIAKWALQSLDLRHRYTFARYATELNTTPGIANCIETAVVLAIYEAAVGKGYISGETIDYERKYNDSSQRTDLAFKDSPSKRKWAYVETKEYKTRVGKTSVGKDIEKLSKEGLSIDGWLFIYRMRKANSLKDLLEKNFSGKLRVYQSEQFDSLNKKGLPSVCEMCLCKVMM